MLIDYVNRHGAQGQFDGASKSTLENEFDTTNEDDIIKMILEKGAVQESEVCISSFLNPSFTKHSPRQTSTNDPVKQFPERQGNKNDSMGSRGGH